MLQCWGIQLSSLLMHCLRKMLICQQLWCRIEGSTLMFRHCLQKITLGRASTSEQQHYDDALAGGASLCNSRCSISWLASLVSSTASSSSSSPPPPPPGAREGGAVSTLRTSTAGWSSHECDTNEYTCHACMTRCVYVYVCMYVCMYIYIHI